jgi:hypothetical protein
MDRGNDRPYTGKNMYAMQSSEERNQRYQAESQFRVASKQHDNCITHLFVDGDGRMAFFAVDSRIADAVVEEAALRPTCPFRTQGTFPQRG